MLFTQLLFLFFFLAAFGVHWTLRSNAVRKLWLLLCSYAFYAAWRWEFLGLIVLSTLVDYAVGRMLDPERPRGAPGGRRLWLVLSLLANLGMLGLFKYFDFFVESGAALLTSLGMPTEPARLELVIPVGISFFTFQTLSYTIDVYRGNLRPIRSLSDFALFVAFFPQLVAGPIVRATEFLPQLAESRRFAKVDVRACALLFLFGWVKKACVADNFAALVDPVFAEPAAYGAGSLWLALVLYTVQIYCDFSGYTDMAIATAGLLGYRLAVNFAFPYLAPSVTEFWRRWHISLSTWFRDYLYIPLGGSRAGELATYRNLLVVFVLCGLWHGASWRFLTWGLIHGFFLVVERRFGSPSAGPARIAGHAYTLFVVALAWVFFRAESFPLAGEFLAGLFGATGLTGGADAAAVVAEAAGGEALVWGLLAGFAVVHVVMSKRLLERGFERLPSYVASALYGALWALAFPWAAVDYQPFIYFQF